MSDRERQLREELQPLVDGLGFKIVELRCRPVKGTVHLQLVIYSDGGVSIDDCAAVHRTIQPRAELFLDDRDLAVQVASPGVDRVFKENSEFGVFSGKGVQVLLKDGDTWVRGIIGAADDRSVTIRSREGDIQISFANVQKAKLDYAQEVG